MVQRGTLDLLGNTFNADFIEGGMERPDGFWQLLGTRFKEILRSIRSQGEHEEKQAAAKPVLATYTHPSNCSIGSYHDRLLFPEWELAWRRENSFGSMLIGDVERDEDAAALFAAFRALVALVMNPAPTSRRKKLLQSQVDEALTDVLDRLGYEDIDNLGLNNGPDEESQSFWWDGTEVGGFKPTEFLMLCELWKHQHEPWKRRELEAEFHLLFAWKWERCRNNFERHKTGIWKCFAEAGFEKPFGLTRDRQAIEWYEPKRLPADEDEP